MSTIVVLADPPVEGAVLGELVETSPLDAADACRLYEAMLCDVCAAVQDGPGELLVNYRPADQLPVDVDSEARLTASLGEELSRPADVRYEVQVGESVEARAGNTAAHLLESEGVDSVVLVEPTAAFLSRQHLGTVTMKLRTRPIVLGPTTRGRVYLTGLTDHLDFEGLFDPPSVETITARADEADLDVGFGPMLPVIETGADLYTALPHLRSRVRAGRNVPPRTATVIADLGLRAVQRGDDLALEMA